MAKKKQPEMCSPGRIGWNELVTTNAGAAKKFYTKLTGWKTQPFGHNSGYTLFLNGKDRVAGMMQCPKKGNPAAWISYINVADVDASAKKALKLGGKILVPAMDIPDVGRIAVLEDPQGAAFGIFQPKAQ